jgi:hypothetical protein
MTLFTVLSYSVIGTSWEHYGQYQDNINRTTRRGA